MNNLQKDLQENIKKYNKKYHYHKKVKVINYYYSTISNNFIRF